ncbi:MAG: 23S rRNA (pseudouridine(1915)-N(3))-methyltransferase RlmH [Christensenellaceae bacterium]|nr:23S rRNA (pseudouridine(1915)-N(3))-methyltransferase RlmH [Christensenellaceae bacterium]
MIKINFVVVGHLKEKYWNDAFSEYAKRISRFAELKVYEVAESSDAGSIELQKSKECAGILNKLTGFVILTDRTGDIIDDKQFADLISQLAVNGISEISYVIGGSHGVSESIKMRANKVVSFGKLTFPHRLMRIILAEQIYRALTIINGLPYHK